MLGRTGSHGHACRAPHRLGERGLVRDQLYTRGYWKLGAADHPDHDTGED